MSFSEGVYNGRMISTSVQGGSTVLPVNISFIGGKYSANNVPVEQLPYTDPMPFTGTYQLQTGGTVLALTNTNTQLQPLPVISLLSGQFTIAFKTDSLILTQTLQDGSSTYQYRLKRLNR
ncbi:hypothetical protein ACFGVR_14255 [Mucilaginibacter sp. AW1-3]